ncbi:sphingosine hydroxylase [Trametes versicolor FP-101664 SS1]|uniref:sphingosine hydroxylase n=1 Tax=Trametes versicolor (strain FP-101664) TaxID=717944 RepID=UPI0004622880|nr:sphingosine hydroxylase [Trametes versicolor FP-101664 SS1]EIW65399.1 sphingosine hydroxylase [Trametes versicolor FP-101664 SS1]
MNTTTAAAPTFLDHHQLQFLATHSPIYYTPHESVISGIPDHVLALAAPVIIYWVLSAWFHVLDTAGWKWPAKYRIHESAEVMSKNLATRGQVLREVILQQLIQTGMGLVWMEQAPAGAAVDHVAAMLRLAGPMASVVNWVLGPELGGQLLATRGAFGLYTLYWWAIPLGQLLIGIFVIDSWQYFLHRALHMNTYLYKTFHAQHHRLYVPYAYGTLYNHPVEGFLMDTLGALVAERAAQLTMREATLLFVVATAKAVNVHCGYNLPWDPLQIFTANNADYHDIHHQAIGIKSNFAQPFFIHWDTLLGTHMSRKDIERRKQEQKEKLSKVE